VRPDRTPELERGKAKISRIVSHATASKEIESPKKETDTINKIKGRATITGQKTAESRERGLECKG